MAFRTFGEMGWKIADSWGVDDGGDIEAKIERLSDDQIAHCLLAAAVYDLRAMRRDVARLRRIVEDQRVADDHHPVADGMLDALRVSVGDVPIAQVDQGTLSSRARNSLLVSGVTMLSEVTAERLLGVRNCGLVTVDELVAWANAHKGTA